MAPNGIGAPIVGDMSSGRPVGGAPRSMVPHPKTHESRSHVRRGGVARPIPGAVDVTGTPNLTSMGRTSS